MWRAKGLSHSMYMYPLSLNFSFLFILCHLYEGNKVKHCFPPHFTPVLKFCFSGVFFQEVFGKP